MWDKTGKGKTEVSKDTNVAPRNKGRSRVEASQQEKMLV